MSQGFTAVHGIDHTLPGAQCRDVSVWRLTRPSGRVERRERGGPKGEAQERRVLTQVHRYALADPA
jgi:hypothetical protein